MFEKKDGMTIQKRYRELCSQICLVAKVVWVLMLIFSVLNSLAALLCVVATKGYAPTDEQIMAWSIFMFAYTSTVLARESRLVGVVFKQMKTLDSPFRTGVFLNMQKVGSTLIFGALGGLLLILIYEVTMGIPQNHHFLNNYWTFVIMLLIGMIVRAFSMVFAYGCKLQDEADETL